MRLLRRVLPAFAAAVVLAAAPAAPAKPGHGPAAPVDPAGSALVCGASGCVSVAEADALPLGGPIGREAPSPAPYHTVAFWRPTKGGAEAYTVLYVEEEAAIAANGVRPGELTWFPVFGPGREAAARAVRGLEPFPAPEAWPAELKSPGRVQPGEPATAETPAEALPGQGTSGRGTAVLGAAALVGLWALGLVVAARPRRHATRR